MNKKITGILIAIALIIGAYFVYTNYNKQDNTSTTEEVKTIKIGAILPLTGPGGVAGEYLKNGIELAFDNDSINNVRLIIEDSKSIPSQGINSYNKLINVDKIDVCITALSSVTMSIIPKIDSKTPVLSTLLTYPNVTEKSEYLYRNFINSAREAKQMSDYLINNKYKNVTLVYNNDEGGIGSANAFEKSYVLLGGNIVSKESYPANSADFRNLALKAKQNTNYNAIYVVGYGKSLGLIIKQFRESNINVPIFTMSQFGANDARIAAGKFAEKVIYTSPGFQFFDTKNNEIFKTEYFEKYKSQPNFISAYGYETGKIILEAVKVKSKENLNIIDAINRVDIDGLNGKLKFNRNREIENKLFIVEWNEGNEILKPSNLSK